MTRAVWNTDGFYVRKHDVGGPITGSGPGFASAMRKHTARQDRMKHVGKWRKAPCAWKKDKGTYIDPEYYIVNYGGA